MKKEKIEKIDNLIEELCDGISARISAYGNRHIETVVESTKALAELVSARASLKED